MSSSIGVTAFKTAGMFLQYLVPMALLLAALMSWSAKRRRTKLLAEAESRAASAPLQQMSWREFEQVVGAHFERLGYSVSFTPDGSDGGVDVVARMGSETFLIQCKQWRATQVGVSVVRELFGVMAARGATGAFVVSIGPFTTDARNFADGRNIELVDANALLRSSSLRAQEAVPVTRPAERSQAPTCPKCGSAMVRRVAKQGANQGRAFFGCSTYPKCRSTVPAD
jgi:restriction system protein